ncbi:DNA-binding protein [Pseudonocardia sp. N23]|uniref:DNA-binding protein n=1 Tax=Pseudonocardia sp. N23 TaxID=1987376 RepID=UPI000BFCD328|nr:DNA-binding protein [Pseudonocardia sp. N23]GAY07090.1 hypothetical protein TOK_1604 [Pseudonocardia sp. N23]
MDETGSTDGTDSTDLPRGIGRPATRALVLAGYTRLAQLDEVPATDLLALHGVGPKAIRVLTEALAERGMALG